MKTIQIVLAVIGFIIALGSLASGAVLTALVSVAISVLILPKTRHLLYKKFPKLERKHVLLALTALTIAFPISIPTQDTPTLKESVEIIEQAQVDTKVETKDVEEVRIKELQEEAIVKDTPIPAVPPTPAPAETPKTNIYTVTKVIDGDTIEVNGSKPLIRLIGIDAPETNSPYVADGCYGDEATAYLTELLQGKTIILEADPTQGNTDKYDRLLRFAFLQDKNINEELVRNGYAKEYTYNAPYKYQRAFQEVQNQAQADQKGIWSPECQNIPKPATEQNTVPVTADTSCKIKGNINSKDEKIYHLPTCRDYKKTQINEDKGERWFCGSQEAVDAGWRIAGSC